MSIKKAVIEITPTAGQFFPGIAQDDLVLRTTDNSQRIFIGTLSNAAPAISIQGSNVGINGIPVTGYTLDVQGPLRTGALQVTGTDAVLLPRGTTAQRPAGSQEGYIRYNAETSQFEGLGAAGAWGSLGGVSATNQRTFVTACNDDTVRFVNSNAETARLTAQGRLGLGTSNPQFTLDIRASDGVLLPTGTTAQRPASNMEGLIRYNTETSQFEGLAAGGAWGSLGGVSATNQRTFVTACNDDSIRFVNSNLETVRVTSQGRLGLGTSNPTERLEVNGNIKVGSNIFVMSRLGVGTSNLATTYGMQVAGDALITGTLTASNFAAAGRILPTSNLAFDIGSAEMRFRDLYLSGNTLDLGGVKIQSHDNGIMVMNSNSEISQVMASKVMLSNYGQFAVFTSNDCLGIGKSNPNAFVNVGGDLSVDGDLLLAATLQTQGIYVLKNSNINVNATTSLSAILPNLQQTELGMSLYVPGTTSNHAFRFFTSNTSNQPLTLNGPGYVGMTDPYPFTRLSIAPTAYEPKILLKGTGPTSNVSLGVSSNAGGTEVLNFHIPSSNAAFLFQHSGSNGTGQELLRVHGTGVTTLIQRDATQPVCLDFQRGGTPEFRLQNSNAQLIFKQAGSATEILRLSSTGMVGISNASPLANLDVRGTFATNGTYIRKDFVLAGASAVNTWSPQRYLGELAANSIAHLTLTSTTTAGASYAFQIHKPRGTSNAPQITFSTRHDPVNPTIHRVRLYWSTGSTHADDYYHLWADWYETAAASPSQLTVTLDVYGANPSGVTTSLPWLSTAAPAVTPTQLGNPTLHLIASNGRVGIGTTTPDTTFHVNGHASFSLFGSYVSRTVVSDLSPNVWAVAGEANTRVGNYAVTATAGINTEIINGKRAWRICDQDNYIEIPFVINSTANAWTVAIAIASPPISIPRMATLFNQIVGDADANQNANHAILFHTDFRSFHINEILPSTTGYQATILPPSGLPFQSVLVFRQNITATSFSIWVNGVKMDQTSTFTKTYTGATPTKMRLGAPSLNVATKSSPIGIAIASWAAWATDLTDAQVRSLTYDTMTAI